MRRASRKSRSERFEPRRTGSDKQTSNRTSELDRLHQQHGNRMVQKLYRAGYLGTAQRQTSEEDPKNIEEEQVCTPGQMPSIFQPKLKLSSPGDVQEQEAEQVAEEVSTLHTAASTSSVGASFLSDARLTRMIGTMTSTQRSFHRTMSAGRKLQVSPSAKADATEANTIAPDVESRILRSRGAGQPLPSHVQNAMSISTGYDFSAVRVKTDSEAAALNQSTNARAFTLGSDIWLGKNESPNDVRLMAHELTHVVQQGGARPVSTVSSGSPEKSSKKNSVMGYLQGLAKDAVHDPSIFRKEIDRFTANNPPGQIAELQRKILETSSGAKINQKSDSKVMRACGCSGGGPAAPAAGPCAIPTSFKETARRKDAGGILHFEYEWKSSTGSLADLKDCEVGEHVTYTKTEDPPWIPSQDPTILWVPGADGALQDNHSPGLRSTYKDSTETAVQLYRFHCPCHDSDKPTNLLGPIGLTRECKPKADGKFRYKITKSGISNTIDPLP